MKPGSTMSTIIGVVLLFVALFLLGGGLSLLGNTMVEWWVPAIVAAIPAIATAIPLIPRWSHLFGFRDRKSVV